MSTPGPKEGAVLRLYSSQKRRVGVLSFQGKMYSIRILSGGMVSISLTVVGEGKVQVYGKVSASSEDRVTSQFWSGWWAAYKDGKVMLGRLGLHDLDNPLLEWTDTDNPLDGVDRIEMAAFKYKSINTL